MSFDFQWSNEEYSPLELIDKFTESVPIIVKVKDGYCGDNSWECLSRSEVLSLGICVFLLVNT